MTLKKRALFVPAVVQLQLSAISLILAVATLPARSQTGSVEGHVFCNDGNVPARDAHVHLIPLETLLKQSGGATHTSLQATESSTDFAGNYVFPSVATGTYVVYVRKDGYSSEFELVRAVLDRLTLDEQKKLLADFPEVTVGSGTAHRDLVIHRGAAISGRVTVDTGGIPGMSSVEAAMVSSDLLGDMEGGKGQKPLDYSRTGQIDDRGVYRIAGLPAGTYRVQLNVSETYFQASMNDGKVAIEPTRMGTGGVTVFAPDAIAASDAKLVQVSDGDELSGVDITIPISRLYSIGGAVTQDGAPVAQADLIILRGGKRLQGSDAISMSDGSYRFDLLPAGIYTIEAKYRDPSLSSGHSVTQTITVQLMDNDIPDANIELPASAQAK